MSPETIEANRRTCNYIEAALLFELRTLPLRMMIAAQQTALRHHEQMAITRAQQRVAEFNARLAAEDYGIFNKSP